MITDYKQRINVLNRRIEKAKQNGDDRMLGGLLELRNHEIINHKMEAEKHVTNLKRVTL